MVSESVKVVMEAEQAAAADLSKAKEDAKRIISDSRADGERIIAEAKEKANAEAQKKTEAARSEAQSIADRGARAAAADVAALKGEVEGKLPEAKAAALKLFME